MSIRNNSKQLKRSNFRNEVFNRDGHKCKICQKTENLDAHHIIDRHEIENGGYVKENGITLCPECHLKAEAFHRKLPIPKGFSPQELFVIIGSSEQQARNEHS